MILRRAFGPASNVYTFSNHSFPRPCAISRRPNVFSSHIFSNTPPVRRASQRGPTGPRQAPRYNRFNRAQQLHSLWRTSPSFRYCIGAVGIGGGIFYCANLERVPISGRLRFNCFSAATEESIAQGQFQMIMQQFRGKMLPPNHPYSQQVNKVLARLIPVAGLERQNWEVRVIDDPKETNAFVMPG